jgi:hypothetical protein
VKGKISRLVLATGVATSSKWTDGFTPTRFAEPWAAYSIDGELVPHSVSGTIVRSTEDTTLCDRRLGGAYEIAGAEIRLRYDCLQPSPGEEQCPGDRPAQFLDDARILLSNGIEYRAVLSESCAEQSGTWLTQ